jgi:hypothetical protein
MRKSIIMNAPPTMTKSQFEAQIRGNLSKEYADYIMGLFLQVDEE